MFPMGPVVEEPRAASAGGVSSYLIEFYSHLPDCFGQRETYTYIPSPISTFHQIHFNYLFFTFEIAPVED